MRTDRGFCPDCGSRVAATWEKDTVCLQPWCDMCQRFLLEDEVDWDQPNKGDTMIYRIYGDPVAYTAPKMALRRKKGGGKYPAFITPEKYKAWKNRIIQAIKGTMSYDGPWKGPICITLLFFIRRPKSSTRKLPTVKPDLDNLCKGVIDALKNDLLFHDDSQIIEINSGKYYCKTGEEPGVAIKLYTWMEGE